MDEREYTFVPGTGLIEDAATANDQPEEGTPEFEAYQAAQVAANALVSLADVEEEMHFVAVIDPATYSITVSRQV